MLRLIAAAVIACACGLAHAHDLITVDSAQNYLSQAQQRLDILRSRQPAGQRAEAACSLGRMLDEIREMLNRDISAHGRVQGLASEYLVRELRTKGLPMEASPSLGHIPADVRWYRECLRLEPAGAHADAAALGLLTGSFYDSFDVDPLRPRAQTWSELTEQVDFAERLAKRAAARDREEVQFILAVLCVRGARAAPDRTQAARHRERARTVIAQFQAAYPDRLRAAAMPVLLQELDAAQR